MAYTSLTSVNIDDVFTTTLWEQIKSNFRYLKGEDGAIALDSALTAPGITSTGTGALYNAKLSSATALGQYTIYDHTNAIRSAWHYIGASYGIPGRDGTVELATYGNAALVMRPNDLATMWLTSDGRVGVGRSPTGLYKFDVNGTSYLGGNTYVSGSLDLGINSGYKLSVAGSAWKNDGSGTWLFASDGRAKNLASRRPFRRGLAALRGLVPTVYTYNGKFGTDATDEHIGLVAQEAEAHIPEMIRQSVMQDGDTTIPDFRQMTLDPLIYALVNAVNELADYVGIKQ